MCLDVFIGLKTILQHPGRNASGNAAGWDALGDNASCSDDRSFPYGDSFQDRDVGTDPDIIFNLDWLVIGRQLFSTVDKTGRVYPSDGLLK